MQLQRLIAHIVLLASFLLPAQSWAAIALAQSCVTGTGNLTLNGVAAGNTLVAFQSSFRGSAITTAIAVPTDTNGTFVGGISGVGGLFQASTGVAIQGIFYEVNAASGTHTVTFEANGSNNKTLCEFSGMATADVLDVSANAKTDNSDITSQVTGTTGTTSQADELIVIAVALAATVGSTDVTFTNPVSGFTSLQVVPNDASDIATFHAYKIVSATGTQAATFNWTQHETSIGAHAAIAAFKASGGASPETFGFYKRRAQ